MKKLFSTLLMGVFILTSVSVFTSCKDNDDDIKAIREDVAALRAELTNVKAALETELQSSKSQFETQIAQVKKELQDAIDKKADEATVSALREKLTGLETDYLAKVAVLETQIETANKALSKLDEKADKATVDNVIANLAALTGQLSDESKAREALEANLAIQIEALKKLRQELTDANYQGQIDGLIQACQNFETTVGDVSVMKKTINNLELQLTAFNQYISALTVLVERQLNSISLVPQLFVGGIEAIEFVNLKYQEFGKTGWYILDKGKTEATYRLNPSTVQPDGIDESGIEFLAATAAVTPEYMFAPAKTRNLQYIPSPVVFNGIKSFKNGLMTVYLKKRDRDSNINWRTNNGQSKDGDNVTPLSEDSIYIVALKVPRNANQYEAADVISENSRLVERWYSPRIACSTPPTSSWHADNNTIDQEYYDGVNNDCDTLRIQRPKHYWDYNAFWGTSPLRVDSRPLEGVSQIVDYDQTFNVSDIVTGCLYEYTTTAFGGACVRKIDVDELKEYGIEIRYSIPTDDYHVYAFNGTNQQEFGVITDPIKGTIKSKTPANVSDNKAVIGKEPVVMIQMIDVTRNKVIDERYLKIKWSDKRHRVNAQELTFEPRTQVLKPCDTNIIRGLTWREVVNEVYAKVGDLGVSEQVFREVYWTTRPEISVSWDCTNWDSNWANLTSAPKKKDNLDPSYYPQFIDATNIHGDAFVATWQLDPYQIKTVYCNSKNDTKTFTARVKFRTRDHRYPDYIWFDWKVTFTLPTLPEIVGYYDQYWYDSYKFHDILPLQYQSDIQRYWENVSTVTKDYCFFDNNLMNPFTYEGTNKPIVKNIPECGSWDIQFAYKQSIPNHMPNYTPNTTYNNVLSNNPAITWDDIYDTGNSTRIFKSAGKEVDTHNFDSYANLISWPSFGAYQYWKTPMPLGPQKLQMAWANNDGDNISPMTLTNHEFAYDHKAWNNGRDIRDRRTYLRTIPEHYTLASDWDNNHLKSLLNELDPNPANDVVRPGTNIKEPARTHTKPLDINIWGALNAWNYIPVKSYQAYMIAPLRFNMDPGKDWYDGQVDGSPVNWKELITLTDFRGYLVSDIPAGPTDPEQKRWTTQLWKFYEVQIPNILTSEARFSFRADGGSVVIDNTIDPRDGMTAAELYRKTNGNVDISFERRGDWIYFWNNGGSRIEAKVRVWIPIILDYGLGRFDGRVDRYAGIESFVNPHI